MAGWHVPFYDGFYERFSSVCEIYRQITGCLSTLEHALQLTYTTGRLKLDILMGGGHIGSPLARVHFERPATTYYRCIIYMYYVIVLDIPTN